MAIDVERIKSYILEKCEAQLNYYDIVDENSKTVDYEAIADFVIGLFARKN